MITRRQLLGAAAVGAVGGRPPNVLLLLGDNWAAPHAGVYGDPVVRTPTFDRIAREGVVFTRAFAPNPSCSPSRSSLLAGQPTHRLGEAASLYGPLAADVPLYTDQLTAQGYFTGYSDKGFGPGTSSRPGRSANPAGELFPAFDAFLGARPAGKPFCFWYGSHQPHVPWNQGRAGRKRMESLAFAVPPHLPDHPTVRADMLDYYCEVEDFDQHSGRLLAALERSGELDQTLVIMTSDNGWQMPRGLANCYDLGVRVPLAMRLPKRIRPGSVRTDFVSIASLASTILEAAGVAVPGTMTAPSLWSRRREREIFLERERHANVRRGNLSYPVRGVRNERYLYLRNLEPDRWPAGDPEFFWSVGPYGDIDSTPTKAMLMAQRPAPFFDLSFGRRPAEELYDLARDPGQIHNVAAQPSHAAALRRLRVQVDDWMRQSADPRAQGSTDFWDRAPYSGPRFEGLPPPEPR
ncbi:MAG: sulfatase [Acidobacteria bacterium]|nr:sulfatase [Acidobacteriota bacterium]